MIDDKDPVMTRRQLLVAGGAFTALIGALFLAYHCILSYTLSEPLDRGVFGDSFGALNAFFTAIAFIGVAFALYYQHKEIRRNYESDLEARKDSSRIARIQAKMVKIQNRQAKTMLATAQFTAYKVLIQSYQDKIKNSTVATTAYRQAEIDLDHALLVLKMLIHKHEKYLVLDWMSYLQEVLQDDLAFVQRSRAFFLNIDSLAPTDNRIEVAKTHNRLDTMRKVTDKWITIQERRRPLEDVELRGAIGRALSPSMHFLNEHAIKGTVPLDNSCFDVLESTLNGIAAALAQ